MNRIQPDRIWIIDELRGLAIVLMVFFHLLVDLRDFFGYAIAYYASPWIFVGRTSAILFMLVSGASCSLSANNGKRGVRVFLLGMVVTLATFLFIPTLYIRFGILHFLGSAMILWGIMDKLIRKQSVKLTVLLLCSPLFLLLGIPFGKSHVESPYLFFLGLITSSYSSYDHYPLIPWLGVFFIGGAAGILLLKSEKNKARLSAIADPAGFPKPVAYTLRGLMALGRKSLLIYIVHQPLMLALLYLFHKAFTDWI
ncbi:MAG: DUF1624 domain-containing protein [Clostridiales bacterium]|nr:DUF1624 domain-containing protein [Clostridiales bacterium]